VLKPAFDNILPSLFGALGVVFVSKNPKIAAAPMLFMVVLFLLVTKVAIPSLNLPEAAAATMSASFSWPQLVTAAIGGVIAVTIAPVIRKALKR